MNQSRFRILIELLRIALKPSSCEFCEVCLKLFGITEAHCEFLFLWAQAGFEACNLSFSHQRYVKNR